jgi:hypothetical protein
MYEVAVHVTVTLCPLAETEGVFPAPRVLAFAAPGPEALRAQLAAAAPGKAAAAASRSRRNRLRTS